MNFRIGSTQVYISLLFFITLTLLLWVDRTGAVLCAALSAAVHEGGHLAALCRMRLRPQAVRLRLPGIEVVRAPALLTFRRELLLALAGPCANFVLALFGVGAGLLVPNLISPYLPAMSAAMGAYNLLPVAGLDGGDALLSLLYMRIPPEPARRILRVVSAVCLALLALLCAYLLWRGRVNVTLLIAGLYLLALLILDFKD